MRMPLFGRKQDSYEEPEEEGPLPQAPQPAPRPRVPYGREGAVEVEGKRPRIRLRCWV